MCDISVTFVFLCGGFGSRLERDFLSKGMLDRIGINKALLPLTHDRVLLDFWIDSIANFRPPGSNSSTDPTSLNNVCLVTNKRDLQSFLDWKDKRPLTKNIDIYCNNILDNGSRNGSVKDLVLGINHFQLNNKPIVVVAGDTLLKKFKLSSFVLRCLNLNEPVIVNYTISDSDCLKSGVLELDHQANFDLSSVQISGSEFLKVTNFLEKPHPSETSSRLGCPCFYFLPPKATKTLNQFLAENSGSALDAYDAAGKWIAWLVHQMPLFTVSVDGRLDIGDLNSYLAAIECVSSNAAEWI